MPLPRISGAPVPSLHSVKGRPLAMGLGPAGRERRDVPRRDAIVRRLAAEFREMPGLVLTVKQASRLLGVEETACARILASLADDGVLRRRSGQSYAFGEPGA